MDGRKPESGFRVFLQKTFSNLQSFKTPLLSEVNISKT